MRPMAGECVTKRMVCPASCSLAQQVEHDFLVGFVEIARGFVGQDQLGMIDQRPRQRHALLLAAGKRGGQMLEAAGPGRRAPAPQRPLFRRRCYENTAQASRSRPPKDTAPDETAETRNRSSRRDTASDRSRRERPRPRRPRRARPLVWRSSPPRILISVVLPEPEGPMMEIHSPSATSKLTPSSARNPR